MNKPFLLFAVKCSVILYFVACTALNSLTIIKSATPLITKGIWRINLYQKIGTQLEKDLSCYSFTFRSTGELKVTINGNEIKGNWSEDDILKRISISLDETDPTLNRLNGYWNIIEINNSNILLQPYDKQDTGMLNIASL
jgi:hypothetical protein